MSLHINQLFLRGFRGYSSLCLDDLSRLNIIVGPNASGKTNIIEGIQLLSCASSFRRPLWGEVISWGCERAELSATYSDENREVEHHLFIKEGEREYKVNGNKKSNADMAGSIPCVLFTPDCLSLVKNAASVRRDMLDDLGIQLSSTYQALRREYIAVLRQRNQLLRDGICCGDLFDSYSESLAQTGARLCVGRWKLLEHLKKAMKGVYSKIATGDLLDASYIPSWMSIKGKGKRAEGDKDYEDIINGPPAAKDVCERILSCLIEYKEEEERKKASIAGPHKDEVVFFINGRNARIFASQGQQRSIALAEKFAEAELIEGMKGTKPLLLLDDVMSELDLKHREALSFFLRNSSQTFVTTSNLGYFSDEVLSDAHIIEVPIPGTRIEYA